MRVSAVAFAIFVFAAFSPGHVLADRVVLYPVEGRAASTRLDAIEEKLAQAIASAGHQSVAPPGGMSRRSEPRTSSEMTAAAQAANATYVVAADIEVMRGQYRMHIKVGYAPNERVEELVVLVLESEEDARLTDVLRSMLRPEGLGEDALRLTGETATPPAGESDEERRTREAREAEARAEAERAAQEQAARDAEDARTRAEAAERAEAAWNARPLYGHDGPWLVAAGGEGGYAMGFAKRQDGRDTGGGIGFLQVRAGRMIPGVDGLEVRAGLDGILGVFGGLGVVVGATWQWTPFLFPLHLGASLELGASFAFTGRQDAGFLIRASAIVSYELMEHLQIELALPELGVVTNGAGALLMGASLRVGYRFGDR